MAEQLRPFEIPDTPESDVRRAILNREDMRQVMSRVIKSWDETFWLGDNYPPDDLGPPARLIRPPQPEGGDSIAMQQPREKLAA